MHRQPHLLPYFEKGALSYRHPHKMPHSADLGCCFSDTRIRPSQEKRTTARTSQRLGLWPFKVVASGDPNDGKWVFIEKDMQKLDLWRRPLKCTDAQYYSEIDNGWINNNPKLVKNPYQ